MPCCSPRACLTGRDEARAALAGFWRRMSDSASFLPATSLASVAMNAGFGLFSGLSPYQFNPFDLNPLREALAATVDFESLTHALTGATAGRRDARARRPPADFPQ